MAERGTKDVLLRLRRARELELRRALTITRAARADARRTGAGVEAARRKLEDALTKAAAKRADPWDAPRQAGRLARAEGFERGLRAELGDARKNERKAAAELDSAEARLAVAQRELGDAVLARQRSESLALAERTTAARAKERREQTEVEDRYRGPGGALARRALRRGEAKTRKV